MTKTDDVLQELCKTFDAYIRGVFAFKYNNKFYRLIDNYIAQPYMRCDVCGNYPLFEVSIIESDGGKRLCLGSNCIDYMTGRPVSEWFKSYRKKRASVIENRKYIDQLTLMLETHYKNELSFQIADGDVEKISVILVQMCNGLALTTKEEQILECYTSRKA